MRTLSTVGAVLLCAGLGALMAPGCTIRFGKGGGGEGGEVDGGGYGGDRGYDGGGGSGGEGGLTPEEKEERVRARVRGGPRRK